MEEALHLLGTKLSVLMIERDYKEILGVDYLLRSNYRVQTKIQNEADYI